MILFRFIFAISCRLRAMDTLVEQEMDIEGGGFFSVFFFFAILHIGCIGGLRSDVLSQDVDLKNSVLPTTIAVCSPNPLGISPPGLCTSSISDSPIRPCEPDSTRCEKQLGSVTHHHSLPQIGYAFSAVVFMQK